MDSDKSRDTYQPLMIGYYDPFNTFHIVEKDLKSRFPLTNLHWKYDSSKPLKSIPLLPISLKEIVPKKTNDIVNCIYLHLMLVKCDSIDIYRSQVRPLIKEWLKNTVSLSNSEWMVLLVVPSNAKDKSSTIIKLSIHDKLKVDFGIEGKELPKDFINESNNRIFKIKEDFQDASKLETYNTIIGQLKEHLLSNFTKRYSKLFSELDRSRMLSQQSQPEKIQNLINKNAILLNLAELLFDMRLNEDSLKYYTMLNRNMETLYSVEPHLFEFSTPTILPPLIPVEPEDIVLRDVRRMLMKTYQELSQKFNIFGFKCFLFIRKSNILQSLAANAQTLSASSSYIASLYQNLLVLLNEMYINNTTDKNLNVNIYEWSYKSIESFLNLSIVNLAMERSEHSSQSTPQSLIDPLHEILECKGELKLFQRTLLVELASFTKGYQLRGANVLEEISLDEPARAMSGNDTEIVFEMTYLPLILSLKSEECFYEKFQEITESIIENFVISGREKSIDTLSIDIALVKYYLKDYEEALQILEGSSEFFIENGWNFMGGILLDAYLKCIEKLLLKEKDHLLVERNRLIVKTCLNLLSNLKSGENAGLAGINNYGSVKSVENISELFEKIYKYSKLVRDESFIDNQPIIEYDILRLFDISICPNIESDPSEIDADNYYIDVEITNIFGVEIQLNYIALELANDANSLVFRTKDCILKKETNSVNPGLSNKIRLLTKNFVYGSFKIFQISFSFNENLKLSKTFPFAVGENLDFSYISNRLEIVAQENDHTIILQQKRHDLLTMNPSKTLFSNMRLLISPSFEIFCYPRIHNLWFEFIGSFEIELGRTELLLRVHGGNSDATDLNIQIAGLTTGLELIYEEITCVESHGKRNCFKHSSIIIDKVEKNSYVDIKVPYIYFSESKIIQMKATIDYELNGKRFSHVSTNGVDTTLTVSVSVQDIFKLDHIFSKFQVGTSNPKLPIRILSNKLTSPAGSNFRISTPKTGAGPIIAFGDQPASFFYKIIPINTSEVKSTLNNDDTLDLLVEYRNFHDEVLHVFELYTLSKLMAISLDSYWFLFKNEVFSKLSFDLSIFALYGTLSIQNTELMILLVKEMIEKYVHKKSDKWTLQDLFIEILNISEIKVHVNESALQNKRLSIPVPVPLLRILHLVDFSFERKAKYVVGEPIEVKVNIGQTMKWSKSQNNGNHKDKGSLERNNNSFLAVSSPSKSILENTAVESFKVNILQDDNWLVSGFRKTAFDFDYSKPEGRQLKLELNMIPLNVGKLILPKIEIKLLDFGNANDSTADVLFKNGQESVLVVPELESITFSF